MFACTPQPFRDSSVFYLHCACFCPLYKHRYTLRSSALSCCTSGLRLPCGEFKNCLDPSAWHETATAHQGHQWCPVIRHKALKCTTLQVGLASVTISISRKFSALPLCASCSWSSKSLHLTVREMVQQCWSMVFVWLLSCRSGYSCISLSHLPPETLVPGIYFIYPILCKDR